LHAKLVESHACIKSLRADLKSSIGTPCSSFEVTALKIIELAHFFDRLQYENDELRKMMGWFSSHELNFG
jgi:hypothetical protein